MSARIFRWHDPLVVGNQGHEQALVVAYLHATNRSDHELLRTLVTQDFELVMGEQTVTGIDNVIALRGPEHLKTALSLQDLKADDHSFVATILQTVTWIESGDPADARYVRARFSFSAQLISRVELLG
jgi:hypothetical protein